MKGTSGRTESRLYRAAMYVVLVVGALPILLPLYWMLLAGLKSRERTAVNPPDWLPVDVRTTVEIAGQSVAVTILDDALASRTGVYRVKMKRDSNELLRLPRTALTEQTQEEVFARIGEVERRVEPVGSVATRPAQGAEVTVKMPGTWRSTSVAASAVEIVPEARAYWQVFGQDVPVHVVDKAADGATCAISLLSPTPTIRIAPELYQAGEPGSVNWKGRRLAARQVSAVPDAGYVNIQLVNPADGLRVPAAELREETRVHRYAVIEGTRREVKLIGDVTGGQVRVEVLNEPEQVEVPASLLRTVRRTAYFADILGERREVEPIQASEETTTLRPQTSNESVAGGASPLPPGERVGRGAVSSQATTLPQPLAEREGETGAASAFDAIGVYVPGAIAVAGARVHTSSAVHPQWGNFKAAWHEQSFDLYIANTLFIAALVVLGTVLSCGLVGYAFARLEFRGRDALFLLLLATMMIPGQVTSIPTFVMYVKFGWIDSYKPLIVPHFLAASAFFVFLFRQFLLTIPNDLEDAARIDGCGPLSTWWLIMMPLSKPIIVTVAVFAFTGVWNDFLAPLLYINSDEKQTVALGLQNFKSAFSAEEPQMMMAASIMMIIPTVILFFLAQRAFIRGVVVSGVKG